MIGALSVVALKGVIGSLFLVVLREKIDWLLGIVMCCRPIHSSQKKLIV